MQRRQARAFFSVLVSGLWLAACGTAPEPERGFAEPLGIQQAALCSGTSVSALSIYGISTYQGEMAGNGGWTVSGGANAVWLDYSVDGSIYISEVRTGTSGTWYFSHGGITCGPHLFGASRFLESRSTA